MFFDEEKIKFAKEILKVEKKYYSPVFNIFKSEIQKILSYGFKYNTAFKLIKNALGEEGKELKYKKFYLWVKNNLENSNKKTQTQIEEEMEKIENLWKGD